MHKTLTISQLTNNDVDADDVYDVSVLSVTICYPIERFFLEPYISARLR
jgi:hypothetical protein